MAALLQIGRKLGDVIPSGAAGGAGGGGGAAAAPAAPPMAEVTDLLSAARVGDDEAVEDFLAVGKVGLGSVGGSSDARVGADGAEKEHRCRLKGRVSSAYEVLLSSSFLGLSLTVLTCGSHAWVPAWWQSRNNLVYPGRNPNQPKRSKQRRPWTHQGRIQGFQSRGLCSCLCMALLCFCTFFCSLHCTAHAFCSPAIWPRHLLVRLEAIAGGFLQGVPRGLFTRTKQLTRSVHACVHAQDVGMKDAQSRTPLHFAAGYNHKSIAKMLIEAGAPLEVSCMQASKINMGHKSASRACQGTASRLISVNMINTCTNIRGC
eukprot:135430-Pelagomonas_calceolata.AAC.3